ncbi:MAG TPA: PQQ-binding-like beta-propeller repeat protein, partial [Fimbriimonas sp.]
MHCLHVRERAMTILAVAAGIVLSSVGSAQVNTDFPTYKGNNARTGRAVDPNPGSGSTELRWTLPKGGFSTIVVDNAGPSAVSTVRTPPANWLAPSVDANYAPFYYWTRDETTGELIRPFYEFARTTPATTDPTVPANAANLRTFEWNFTVTTPTLRAWAPYVWLPNGTTILDSGAPIYQSRYFVYQVLVNGALRFSDVVDTYAAGNGWVRLGNGGGPTNLVLGLTGTDVLTIRLLNTMPRGADGALSMPNTDPSLASPTEGQIANQYAVYADAARLVATDGYIVAQPTVMTVGRNGETVPQVVSVRNQVGIGNRSGTPVTTTTGVVSAVRYNGSNTPNTLNVVESHWTHVLAAAGSNATTVDNNRAQFNGFTSSTATGRFVGSDYLQSTLVGGPADAQVVYREPALEEGTYDIYAYISGDDATNDFGTVLYQIREGAAVENFELDQSQTGWVRIGDRRYTHTLNEPLSVRVTNHTSVAADVGKLAFADAVRFVGESDQAVTSTPVQAVVGIRKWVPGADGRPQLDANGNILTQVVQTPVVIVADERGVLHCLDAVGNGDGTTTTYWTYPSTRDSSYADWIDRNAYQGFDGTYDGTGPASEAVVTAIMPTGFDLSSAAIQRIAFTDANGVARVKDLLYIGARNGRVYCVDMVGRGDYRISQATFAPGNLDAGGRPLSIIGNTEPGSTMRRWTYPSDPLDDPNAPSASPIGSFLGSVVYGTTAAGRNTLYVPDSNGRIYALDPLGNDQAHTTTPYWAYPALDQETVGKIVSTPAYEFGKLFFGTMKKDDAPGVLYALNDDGTVAWQLTGTAAATPFSDFRASVATATAAEVGDIVDYLFALNDNGQLIALDPNQATPTLLWSEQINIPSRTSLGFTKVGANVATVVVTGMTGQFMAYRAHQTLPAGIAGRFIFGWRSRNGEELTAPAFAAGRHIPAAAPQGWLYYGDAGGFLYAFSDASSAGSSPDPNDESPLDRITSVDDPSGYYYSKTKFHFITAAMYRRLQGVLANRPDYTTGTTTEWLVDNVVGRRTSYGEVHDPTKYGFDWGQTMYLLVHDFPFTRSGGGDVVVPPTVNLEISVDGKIIRSLPAASLQWPSGAPLFSQAPPVTSPAPDPDPLLDGYAVVQFTLQGGGQNALPPGPATLQLSITADAAVPGQSNTEVTLAQDNTYRNGQFNVLNPIGLSVDVANPGGPANNLSIGFDPYGNKPETITNGSPDQPGLPL